jgi:hypothetical protein
MPLQGRRIEWWTLDGDDRGSGILVGRGWMMHYKDECNDDDDGSV